MKYDELLSIQQKHYWQLSQSAIVQYTIHSFSLLFNKVMIEWLLNKGYNAQKWMLVRKLLKLDKSQ